MTDPRALAVILAAGRDKANEWGGPADVALRQALDAMTEVAVILANDPTGGTGYPLDQVFTDLAATYE